MFDWLADPWTVAVLVLIAVVALGAARLRRWQPLTTALYVLGAVLMIFAIRWSAEFGDGAYYLVAVAGIGTGLVQYAIDRAKVETAPRTPAASRS